MEFFDIFSIIFIIPFLIIPILHIAVIALIIRAIIKTIKRSFNHNYFKNNVILYNNKIPKKTYVDISKKELATFNTDDLNTFKNYFYKLFIEFETAYNNLDYNTMKSLSTKQLYENYYTGITLDLEVGKKRIINNIQKKQVIIYETFSSNAKQVVSAMIEVSYINYTMNKEGQVISGNKDTKTTEKFEVIFRKDFDIKEITNCPNCGAPINNNKCEFCRSIIKNVSFKISSIKKIIDNYN